MLTDKEIDQKLVQVGLPLYGTREDKITRLVRNGLHAAEVKPAQAFKMQDERVVIVAPEGVKSQSEADELAKEAKPIVPRKMGRPKKVQ